MREKYSLTLDPVFKKVFGVEANKDILISLINAIVDKSDQVEGINLLNPYEHDVERKDVTISILDIKAKGKDGTYYNIEVQIANEIYYMERALYYWAGVYRNQLEKGDRYNKISKVIGIHILDFNAIKEDEDYFHKCRLCFTDKEDQKFFLKDKFLETLKLYFIELPKFKKDPYKIEDDMDKWIDVLKHTYDSDKLPEHLKEKREIKKAVEATEVLRLDEKEYMLYEGELKYQRDMASREEQIKYTKEEGKKLQQKARSEGEKKGREEGEKKGREEGEKNAAITITKNFKKQGLTTSQIAAATGLTKKEVENL